MVHKNEFHYSSALGCRRGQMAHAMVMWQNAAEQTLLAALPDSAGAARAITSMLERLQRAGMLDHQCQRLHLCLLFVVWGLGAAEAYVALLLVGIPAQTAYPALISLLPAPPVHQSHMLPGRAPGAGVIDIWRNMAVGPADVAGHRVDANPAETTDRGGHAWDEEAEALAAAEAAEEEMWAAYGEDAIRNADIEAVLAPP